MGIKYILLYGVLHNILQIYIHKNNKDWDRLGGYYAK